jgi:hypothetical protein
MKTIYYQKNGNRIHNIHNVQTNAEFVFNHTKLKLTIL